MRRALTGQGRPLRFLALVVVGWIVLRIAILWPQTGSLPEAIRQVLPVPSFAPREPIDATPGKRVIIVQPSTQPMAIIRTAPFEPAAYRRLPDPLRIQMAQLGLFQFGPAEYADEPKSVSEPAAQTAVVFTPSRWSGSAWLTARQGSGLSTAPGGQLGGSQAGVRIAWRVDERRRIAVFTRFVTPLRGTGREAALGIEWQPTVAPVRLVAEQRFAIDGGKGGPGLGLVAGVDRPIPGGFRLESYGQAGAVHRDRIEPYADGAARATRPIPGTRLSLGVGAWAAAQRNAARVDVGPSATLAVPVGSQNVRIALDWRQRVAGDARPGSGLALTLGSDF